MENFFKRLKYYGIGFGIGLIFVTFAFKNRGCAWYPENRVKNIIFQRILVVSDTELPKMKKLGLTKKTLFTAINEGDIDFGASKKAAHFKVYHMESETQKGKKFTCNITLNEDSFISEVQFGNKSAFKIKNTDTGYGNFMYFPKHKDFVYLDSTETLSCQQKEMKLTDENKLFKQIMHTGKIDFEKSKLMIQPKPEHWIQFKDKKNRIISAKAIWYKEKIEISKFDFEFKSKCK